MSTNAFFWALLAAACWGWAPILEKLGLRGPIDPILGVVVRSLGVIAGLLFMLPFVPQLPQKLSALPSRTWLFLIAGGIAASILGQICFYRALKSGSVSQVVPVGAAYPVLACLLGVLLLGEHMTATKAIGIALVVMGTYLLR